MVTCDLYVPDPTNPKNQAKRVKIPGRALEWTLKRLEEQGATLEKMESMNQAVVAEIAQSVANGAQQPQMQQSLPEQGGDAVPGQFN